MAHQYIKMAEQKKTESTQVLDIGLPETALLIHFLLCHKCILLFKPSLGLLFYVICNYSHSTPSISSKTPRTSYLETISLFILLVEDQQLSLHHQSTTKYSITVYGGPSICHVISVHWASVHGKQNSTTNKNFNQHLLNRYYV